MGSLFRESSAFFWVLFGLRKKAGDGGCGMLGAGVQQTVW